MRERKREREREKRERDREIERVCVACWPGRICVVSGVKLFYNRRSLTQTEPHHPSGPTHHSLHPSVDLVLWSSGQHGTVLCVIPPIIM